MNQDHSTVHFTRKEPTLMPCLHETHFPEVNKHFYRSALHVAIVKMHLPHVNVSRVNTASVVRQEKILFSKKNLSQSCAVWHILVPRAFSLPRWGGGVGKRPWERGWVWQAILFWHADLLFHFMIVKVTNSSKKAWADVIIWATDYTDVITFSEYKFTTKRIPKGLHKDKTKLCAIRSSYNPYPYHLRTSPGGTTLTVSMSPHPTPQLLSYTHDCAVCSMTWPGAFSVGPWQSPCLVPHLRSTKRCLSLSSMISFHHTSGRTAPHCRKRN